MVMKKRGKTSSELAPIKQLLVKNNLWNKPKLIDKKITSDFRKIIDKHGLTFKFLATAIGVTWQQVSAYYHGTCNVPGRVMYLMQFLDKELHPENKLPTVKEPILRMEKYLDECKNRTLKDDALDVRTYDKKPTMLQKIKNKFNCKNIN